MTCEQCGSRTPSPEFSGQHSIDIVTFPDIPLFRAATLASIARMQYYSPLERQHAIGMRTFEYFEAALRHPDEYVLLAAKDTQGKIVGGLDARIAKISDQRTGFVQWVFVDESRKQQGIATALYTEFELRMRARGDIPYIMAMVYDDNAESLALHRKLGITRVFAKRDKPRVKWYYKQIKENN